MMGQHGVMDAHDTPRYARLDRADLAGADRALIEEFAERGFVVIDLDLGDETVAEIIRRMEPLFPSGADRRVLNAWRKVEAVRGLALHAKATATLELLYGRRPFAFQTLNFPVGTEQSTHSDTIHFDSTPHDFMAGVWVALEDVDAGNGPLHYYPGSHRLPRVTLETMGLPGGRLNGSANYRNHYEPAIQQVVRDHALTREGRTSRKARRSSGRRICSTAVPRSASRGARATARSRTTTSKAAPTGRRCSRAAHAASSATPTMCGRGAMSRRQANGRSTRRS